MLSSYLHLIDVHVKPNRIVKQDPLSKAFSSLLDKLSVKSSLLPRPNFLIY